MLSRALSPSSLTTDYAIFEIESDAEGQLREWIPAPDFFNWLNLLMTEITLHQLAEILQGQVICHRPAGSGLEDSDSSVPVSLCLHSIDTRTLKPGELFWALSGEKQDGHLYVEEALQLGLLLRLCRVR